ncbi:MTCH1 isoform 4, partial [Pongo abelii]
AVCVPHVGPPPACHLNALHGPVCGTGGQVQLSCGATTPGSSAAMVPHFGVINGMARSPRLSMSGVLSSIGKIFKEEGLLGFFVGLIPHLLGDVVFLWGCNLLAHFINAYLVDDSFSQALAIRSYTKFVMGIAVSMLTYPFLLVGDLMAVNNCGLQAGLPPYSPVFKSWIHCWKYLSVQGQLFRGSSLLFRRVSSGSCFA